MQPFERILIRSPNPLGDAVMATPLYRCVRDAWPKAEITVLCLPPAAEMLRGLDSVDHVEVYDRRGADAGFAGMMRVGRRLKPRNFDLALVCPNSFSSALLARMAGAERRVGWSYGGRGPLLTDRLVPKMKRIGRRVPRPMVDYYLDLARHLGAEVVSTDTELVVDDAGEAEAKDLLARGGWDGERPLAGLGIGAGFGPSKLWTPAAFAAVGDGLAERGMDVALMVGPGEESIAAAIEERMTAKPVVPSTEVPSLSGLKSLARRLSVVVTTDTGPRHVAVAFGVPVVVVMGPTDPIYTQSNLDRTVVLREEVDCAPYSWPCHEKDCPLTGERRHQCMTRISPERALEAVDDLLG
ncbi:MAG: lipopolysaccharide heptosyltransferase II [Planctomycetota bacterium]